MSDEKNYWDKYLGQSVVIQLRHQPYIGVTGEELVPAANEGGFLNTPVVRGIVRVVSGEHLVLETTDPNPELQDNAVYIEINAERDIGYLTTIKRKLIAVV